MNGAEMCLGCTRGLIRPSWREKALDCLRSQPLPEMPQSKLRKELDNMLVEQPTLSAKHRRHVIMFLDLLELMDQ
jgi:hypothetical protein